MRDSALWTLAPGLDDPGADVGGPTAFWRLTHVCGWESNPQEGYGAKRTLEDVLRWAENHEAECHNEPVGGTLDRTWATVPAGWFVQTPKGDWLEVTDTHLSGSHQFVGLRIGGKVSHWNRPPAGPVKARKGSMSPTLRDEALESLESAFTTAILRDEPPGQS